MRGGGRGGRRGPPVERLAEELLLEPDRLLEVCGVGVHRLCRQEGDIITVTFTLSFLTGVAVLGRVGVSVVWL